MCSRRDDGDVNTFVYVPCNDFSAMRRFYGTLLGLDEIFVSLEGEVGGYRIGTLQFTIQGDATATPADLSWATQLGWRGGTAARISWGVELSTSSFAGTVRRLRDGGVPLHRDEPDWVGYWSFPVRDPMNNTVEVSTTARAGWPVGDQGVTNRASSR